MASESNHFKIEHNYCKVLDDDSMSTQATPTERAPPPTETTPYLSPLAPNIDNIETLLITLLQTHTLYIGGCGSVETTPTTNGTSNGPIDSSGPSIIDINPLSLDTLSNEQINYLITSNAVNYASIQQAMTQRYNRQYNIQKDDSVLLNEVRLHSPSPLPQAMPTPAPPTLSPGTTLTITSNQLRELQSQLSSLLQQQSASTGGGGVSLGAGLQQPSIDAINQLLKHQILNIMTGTTPSTDENTTNNDPPPPQTTPGASLPPSFSIPPPPTATGPSQPHPTNTTITASTSSGSSAVSTTGNGAGAGAGKKKKDQEKRPPTAFNYYFSDVYHKVIEENPNLPFSEVSKIVSSMWNVLGQEGKKKYYDKQEEMKQSQSHRQDMPTTPTTPTASATPTLSVTTKPTNKRPRKGSKEGTNEETIVKRRKTDGMCVAVGCYNMSSYEEERGYKYCCNDCIVNHCRAVFNEWVSGRKQNLKT
ncbi:PREDICTED: TOX high mobility group box family member 4-like [Amphimedon queenslandica]|uniref:HMG box domain-containing protein n=1 Tax=Amphimedon queenslandica TaxID=400682 RepID=A0A1X7TJ94_AMPQE|nr:PREDICTED: TOX high mobility group box family member 4-like [Amphimedon queenslandica]|eukprot:XP_011407454.2 PREDICTED: TOX high mobility group box family member 4-like [Amphimedon queenslandica]